MVDVTDIYTKNIAWSFVDQTIAGMVYLWDNRVEHVAFHVFAKENRVKHFLLYLGAHLTVSASVLSYCETSEEAFNVLAHTSIRVAAVATSFTFCKLVDVALRS